MTEKDILRRLRALMSGRTQRAVAAELGISEQYLCDILKGRKPPGPTVLKALGLSRRVSYI